jgi:hypothetical protein
MEGTLFLMELQERVEGMVQRWQPQVVMVDVEVVEKVQQELLVVRVLKALMVVLVMHRMWEGVVVVVWDKLDLQVVQMQVMVPHL